MNWREQRRAISGTRDRSRSGWVEETTIWGFDGIARRFIKFHLAIASRNERSQSNDPWKVFTRQRWRKQNEKCLSGVSISSGKRNFSSSSSHIAENERKPKPCRVSESSSRSWKVIRTPRVSAQRQNFYQIRDSAEIAPRVNLASLGNLPKCETTRKEIWSWKLSMSLWLFGGGWKEAVVTTRRGSEEQDFSIFRTRRNHFPFALSAKATSVDNRAEIVP